MCERGDEAEVVHKRKWLFPLLKGVLLNRPSLLQKLATNVWDIYFLFHATLSQNSLPERVKSQHPYQADISPHSTNLHLWVWIESHLKLRTKQMTYWYNNAVFDFISHRGKAVRRFDRLGPEVTGSQLDRRQSFSSCCWKITSNELVIKV